MLGAIKDKPKETAAAPEPAPKPKELPTLPKNALRLRESVNNCWRLIYPDTLTADDILRSEIWSAAGGDLGALDTIEAVNQSRTEWSEWKVVSVGKGFVQLLELRRHQLPPAQVDGETQIPAIHRLEHTLAEGWRVLRRNPNGEEIVMSSGHATHEIARRWLLDHATLRQ